MHEGACEAAISSTARSHNTDDFYYGGADAPLAASQATEMLEKEGHRPRARRKGTAAGLPASRMSFTKPYYGSGASPWTVSMLCWLALSLIIAPGQAAFIRFENCLDSGIINSNPPELQFTPLFVNARFNATAASHNLNITIYGNVSGQATVGDYPEWDNTTYWDNPNNTFGKIVDVSQSNNKYSTLFSKYQVLTYTPYNADPSRFCSSTVNTSCPIAPSFYTNGSDPYNLSAFTVAHDFYSSYAFATFASTVWVDSGDAGAPHLACISAAITPTLGSKLSGALRFAPAAILGLVAIATVTAAAFSPWSSSDPFRWTSNYGRDEDVLRLVTPGFGDCLQYIQFIVLAGSLNLNYPGFFQPVVSQAAWSSLMFNQSFVTHGNGTDSLVDGIYNVNGTYGLSRLGQLVGMTSEEDIWAGMAIWLMVLVGCVVALCQIGFAIRWSYRAMSNTAEEDLSRKNWPFTGGNIVRIVYNWFLLPIWSLSMFQLVVANHSPPSVVACAIVMLVLICVIAFWIFRLIFTTRPRTHLFDDFPTVLLYGPLYNTYSDDAAPFAFMPVLVNFLRGVAIGAVQPSGIAQLVLLAICEVIFILTLHAFRPFQSPTSMNAYHTFFSAVRLMTTLLSIAFVPSLGVTESSRGWLGYAILLLHGIVLVFGFFLNSIQTLIELLARQAGVGEARGGFTRVFGKRQLQQRRRGQRSSLQSNAAMLTQDNDDKAIHMMSTRSRSHSASSAILLNQHPLERVTSGPTDAFGEYSSHTGGSSGTGTPGVSGGRTSPYQILANAKRKSAGPIDTFYRPPRPRRPTLETFAPGDRSRDSWQTGDPGERPYQDSPPRDIMDAGEGPSVNSPQRSSIAPAYLRTLKNDSDPTLAGDRRNQTDYTVRESDFYYGVQRGPALSSMPTRKRKTGPADPMGPAASAAGWFMGLFGGKKKEKGKGFEVVRSVRAPQQDLEPFDEEASPPGVHEPYHDSPVKPGPDPGIQSVGLADLNRRSSNREARDRDSMSSYDDMSDSGDPFGLEEAAQRGRPLSDEAPSLAPIEVLGGGLDLPSRFNSRHSNAPSADIIEQPQIPRKSSRRTPSLERSQRRNLSPTRLSTIPSVGVPSTVGLPELNDEWDDRAGTPTQAGAQLMPPPQTFGGAYNVRSSLEDPSGRMPFDTIAMDPSPSPERNPSRANSASSSIYPSDDGGGGHGGMPGNYGPTGSYDVGNPYLTPPPSQRHVHATEGRPLSTGYVMQHRASESVHGPASGYAGYEGAAGEIVDASRRGDSVSPRR